MSVPAAPADVTARLEALAGILHDLGWKARLVSPRLRPKFLFVQNPEPGQEARHSYVQFSAEDGYSWPRAEPLPGDAAEAAAIITDVLGSGQQ
jgi:hypothetical protein